MPTDATTDTVQVTVTIDTGSLLTDDPTELREQMGEECYRTALIKFGARHTTEEA